MIQDVVRRELEQFRKELITELRPPSAARRPKVLGRMTVAEFAKAVDRQPKTILAMIRTGRIAEEFVDRGRPIRIASAALTLFKVTEDEAREKLLR